MNDLLHLLGDSLPRDHSLQRSASQLAEARLRTRRAERVLDVGCGAGNSVDQFRHWQPDIAWVGVDIASSPEVDGRRRKDAEFHTFDGCQLPFPDASFDLAYSKQVLEHVRHPSLLLKDIARVLAPGGELIGSTSHLEPYHSYSFWNYTPHGFKVLVEEAGLELVEIRPCIDALTLIVRRILGEPKSFGRWWSTDSPLNRLLGWRGRRRGQDHGRINATKLLYCGQFSFVCRRPLR